jgi:predicted O-methyltransferase YrrM
MSDDFFNFQPFYRYVANIAEYSRFVEVGVYTGASCAFLAQRLAERGTEAEVFAVDLWDKVNAETDYDRLIDGTVYRDFLARIENAGLTSWVKVIQEESIKAASMFGAGSLDFVFIDANHTYPHVKADSLAWLPKIRPGGMIAGHDYGEPCGVKQAVDELFGDRVSLMGTCWYVFVK